MENSTKMLTNNRKGLMAQPFQEQKRHRLAWKVPCLLSCGKTEAHNAFRHELLRIFSPSRNVQAIAGYRTLQVLLIPKHQQKPKVPHHLHSGAFLQAASSFPGHFLAQVDVVFALQFPVTPCSEVSDTSVFSAWSSVAASLTECLTGISRLSCIS